MLPCCRLTCVFHSNKEIANVTTTTTETIYLYQSTNLIISYSLAIVASTAAVILGSYSLYQNGASYDASVSAFATTMQNSEVFRPLQITT